MAKTEDAIINLPNMISIRVAEPWGKNGSLGSNPSTVLIWGCMFQGGRE